MKKELTRMLRLGVVCFCVVFGIGSLGACATEDSVESDTSPMPPQTQVMEVAVDEVKIADSYTEVYDTLQALFTFDEKEVLKALEGNDELSDANDKGTYEGMVGSDSSGEDLTTYYEAALDSYRSTTAPANPLIDDDLNKRTSGSDYGTMFSSVSNWVAKDESGYIYQISDGHLRVLKAEGAASAIKADLVLSDFSDTTAVNQLTVSGNVLVVECQSYAGENYSRNDYAQAAYSAPRVNTLFFDISSPEEITHITTNSFTGTAIDSTVRGTTLFVVASHASTPDAASYGYEIEDIDAGEEVFISEEVRQNTKNAIQAEQYEMSKQLELQRDEPSSYIPSFYRGDTLVPFDTDQIYIEKGSDCADALVVCAYDLESAECVWGFAYYGIGDMKVPYFAASGLYVGNTWDWDSAFGNPVRVAESAQSSLVKVELPTEGVGVGVSAHTYVDGFISKPMMFEFEDGLVCLTNKRDAEGSITASTIEAYDGSLESAGTYNFEFEEGTHLQSFCIIDTFAYAKTKAGADSVITLSLSDLSAIEVVSSEEGSAWSHALYLLGDSEVLGIGLESDYQAWMASLYDPTASLDGEAALINQRIQKLSMSDSGQLQPTGDVVDVASADARMFEQGVAYTVVVDPEANIVGVPCLGEAELFEDGSYSIPAYEFVFYRESEGGIEYKASIDLSDILRENAFVLSYDSFSLVKQNDCYYLFCSYHGGVNLIVIDADSFGAVGTQEIR